MTIKIKNQTKESCILETKHKFLQQQNDRVLHFKELVRSYVEMDNRLKALEGEADNKILFDK